MFSGVFPMLPTPFDQDGKVSLDDLSALIDLAREDGVQGLSALGLAAEVRQLTVEERKAIATHLAREVSGKLPLLVGVSADDTASACDLAAYADSLGVQMVMVAPPVVNGGLSEDRQVDHFVKVAGAAGSAMVMLQDAPNELGVYLSASAIVRIAERAPNVRYAKLEGTNTGQAVIDLLHEGLGGRLSFFGGTGGLHYMDLLDAGVTGVMPAFEAPRNFVEITRLFADEERGAARAIHARLMPFLVFKAQSLAISVLVVKELLQRKGVVKSAHCRIAPPLKPWSVSIAMRHAQAAGLLTRGGGA
jgi:4-hydroxy-tetrahydrodipicolinate synthase